MLDALPDLPPPGGYVRPEGWESYDEAPAGEAWRRFAGPLEAGIEAELAGDAAGALRRFDEAARELPPDAPFGRLLLGINRAQALLAADDAAGADAQAVAALRLARREKNEHWTALASLGAALVHLARGRRSAARERLAEAVRGFTRHGDLLRLIQCHFLLGEVAYLGEDIARAGSHYRQGAALAREAGEQEWVELLGLRFEHR
jgi:ATP/maltotriose-dependent transcriptional regulator MalT